MATHLVTGANGYVSFHVLLKVLKAGHRVRATVRDSDRISEIRRNEFIQELFRLKGANNLELLEAPDILAPTAYDKALAGETVTHIIHVASPLPFPTAAPRRDIIEPSNLGTQVLLRAASLAKSVRRVVLTSSLAANLQWPPDPTVRTTPSSRVPDPAEEEMDRDDLDLMTAWRYSKITALNAGERFVRENPSIGFDIVNVFPGFVHGPNLLFESCEKAQLKGSNRFLLGILTGQAKPEARLASAAHIFDVAAVHMAALDEGIVPFRSGIDLAATRPVKYNDAWDIVQRLFPDSVTDGTLKQGDQASLQANRDASQTENLCDFKFRPYEKIIVDLVAQYLSLPSCA